MEFFEKISTILKTNKLHIVTKEELSEYCGFNRDTIRKAIERGTELGDRYTRIFQDKLRINPEWWDTGKGDIYLKKLTDEPKSIDNNEMAETEEIYRKIVEGNTEYILIPRSVMQEKYRLVSLETLAKEAEEIQIKKQEIIDKNKELERKDTQIHGLYAIIRDITDMVSKGIQPPPANQLNLPEVEKAK